MDLVKLLNKKWVGVVRETSFYVLSVNFKSEVFRVENTESRALCMSISLLVRSAISTRKKPHRFVLVTVTYYRKWKNTI
jgi:hypothetical protein